MARRSASRQGTMTFLEHLDELRRRLFRAAVVYVVVLAVCWTFSARIVEFLLRPIQRHLFDGGDIVFIHLTEPFLVYMKASAVAALFVASPFTTVAASARAPGYDPVRQFVPVAPIAAGPLAFVVNPGVPAATMRDFIAYARQHPGKVNYGSAGPGSVNHLALELFKARTGTDIVHVPYRGIADATKDLLGGQLQAMTASIPATLPQLAERRVRVLAVTGDRRIAQLPDVPSWQEQGVADANVVNYWGIVAPVGTPQEVVAKLNAATQKVLAQPDVKARLEREGAELIPGPPERLGGVIERDLAGWKKLIADARLTFE